MIRRELCHEAKVACSDNMYKSLLIYRSPLGVSISFSRLQKSRDVSKTKTQKRRPKVYDPMV